MNRGSQIETRVQRWIDGGLIDAKAGASILSFEASQERHANLRWPVFLAMVFGGILLAAGVTLFVAAHWSELSPAARFSLVLLMTVIFHTGGALLAVRFPPLSTTLHALGTATLGAAIFLTAQIFNLHENWATGVLLWSLGAAAGYLLLKDWIQAAFLALLLPGWLISQWVITTERQIGGLRPLAIGLVLTALCYLSARIGDQESTARRTLVWIGGLTLLPCSGIAIVMATEESYSYRYRQMQALPISTWLIIWIVALAGPLLLALLLRGRAAWINLLWAGWTYVWILSAHYTRYFESADRHPHQYLWATAGLYALCAIGSIGLVVWGLYEKRKERLNLGIAAFAISVLFFYFDSFMEKLGRSASLLILGVLCLAGGYVLEITRRRLVARMESRPDLHSAVSQ